MPLVLTELRQKVFKSLDNALDNGYDQVLEYLPEIIADDLKDYDSSYEEIEPSALISHVQAWQEWQKLKRPR
jgi:hypothetical protein